MKKLVNTRIFIFFMFAKSIVACDLEHKNDIIKCVFKYEVFYNSPKLQNEDLLHANIKEPIKKIRDVVNSFLVASTYSLLLMSCERIVDGMMDVYSCERLRIINYVASL